MSHSRGHHIKEGVLNDCHEPILVPQVDSEKAATDSDAADQASITRRHTELLDKLLAMPVKDRGPYLEAAAKAAAHAYENNPALTEFTCLDGEDFEDYSE